MTQDRIPIHITDTEWTRFWQKELTPAEEDQLLSHVCGCDFCSLRMSESIPEAQVLSAPAYLKEETLEHCRKHTRVQRFLQGSRFQFITYSVKVGLAMVVALFLVLTPDYTLPPTEHVNTPSEPVSTFSLTEFLDEGSRYLCYKLNEFTIFDKEDFDHDKK